MTEGSRRQRTARGTIINGLFQVGLGGLNITKTILAAALLTPTEYGVWGVVFIVAATFLLLKQAGISDKYIQQDEVDQELAFQKAFTADLFVSAALAATMAATVPLIALAYDQGELVAPGLVLSLMLPTLSFQSPSWIFYRRLDYFRQRIYESVDPVIGIVVTVGAAIVGLGYWSLVLGTVVGTAAGGIACVLASPYPLRLRFDRGTGREYFEFSWPILIAALSTVAMSQIAVLGGNAKLGLAGAGAITLFATLQAYANRVDGVITLTMYPVICQIRDRADLLLEVFIKSNRLALMWGVPFGVGLSLFAADLVRFVIGEQWNAALLLIQIGGVGAAIHHVGFNWDAFYRARGETRPIATATALTLLGFCATAVPLLFWKGLDGFAVGLGLTTVLTMAVRWRYLCRLFPGFRLGRHTLRATAPVLPAVSVVLILRLFLGADNSLAVALGELLIYAAVTIATTFYLERALLREVMSYLRGRQGGLVPPGVDAPTAEAALR